VRVLRPYLACHWPALAGAGLGTIVLTAAQLAQPWPLKLVLDRILGGHTGTFRLSDGDIADLAWIAGLVIAIAVVGAIASYYAQFWLDRAGQRIVHDLRIATYAHLQRLSLTFHDGRSKGDLVTRVTGDVNEVGTLFSESLGTVVSALLLLVGMLAVTVWLDPVLAIGVFAVTPLLALITFRYRRRLVLLARQERREEGEIASLAAETLSSMRVVKAFGSERFEHDRVERRSVLRREIGIYAARTEARFGGLVDSLGAVAGALVLALGAVRVSQGALTAGDLVVFTSYASRTYRPLRDIARQAGKMTRALARAERIAEVLASDEALDEMPRTAPRDRARGEVVFDDVGFAYPDGRVALRNVTLRVPAGSRVAIVGPSGAGKSTLAALLVRFYDPTSGNIRLDSLDARTYPLQWLRDQIGLLLQDTVLFRGSVADNIAYAVDASDAAVTRAAEAAGASSFIADLPDGYDTDLGPGGIGLSGGQRQRIGIARVLLRDPPLLVLDEPTTGLDPLSEAVVLEGLRTLMHGRTTVIVTHSTRLARSADQVIVLEEGRVVEAGPPTLLLSKPNGSFRSLVEGQSAEETPRDSELVPR
jgi:ATP-binding cassette subfamily B protein